VRDQTYGTDERQTLDIYVPDHLKKPAPVIVFFYGGSWQMGSKDMYRFVGQAFAEKGYITVITDYRLYPQVHFPAFMQDGAQAVRWTRDHIGEYQGDSRNIYLAGHSAGGHIAALLTTDAEYLNAAGVSMSQIRGLIGIAGAYDFLPMTDPNIIALFSKVPANTTQPVKYITSVSAKLPPMLLVWGAEDDTVGLQNIESLSNKALHKGGMVETRLYPDLGHIGIILSLAKGFRDKAPLLKDISDFIEHTRQK
jgi:acetyl esterase/lipase